MRLPVQKEGRMAFRNRLGGHSNSYHSYTLEDALEGISAAGYKFVELSAVRGWTEHVPLEADAKTLSRIQRMMNKLGLMPLSLSGPFRFNHQGRAEGWSQGG
jgi:L-ribulose-5-phosphate 3-epimerase